MLIVFVLYVVLAEAFSASFRADLEEVAAELNERNRVADITVVSEAIGDFVIEHGAVPTSFSVLESTPGYEHIRLKDRATFGYATASNINDGLFLFDRAVAYLQNTLDVTAESAYLSNNECGTGGIVAIDWCGSNDSHYFVADTRFIFDSVKITALRHLERTLLKLIKVAGTDGLPKTLNSGAEMAEGDVVTLAAAVGTSATATTCTGTFVFDGAVLDCRDLFDIYGTTIIYIYINSGSIGVETTLPIVLADGTQQSLLKTGPF